MRNTMANIWHPLGGVEISYLGEKHFLFRFYHELDIGKVEKEAPWTLNSHLLIFHRRKDSLCPTRLYNGETEVVLGWDLSLRAAAKRATIATSVWLREDIAGNNFGNTTDEKNKRSNWRNTNQEGMFRDQWVKTNQILGFNLVSKSDLTVSGKPDSSDFHDERVFESQTSKSVADFGIGRWQVAWKWFGTTLYLVSALLDQYSREWKEEIITHIMSADEASKVLSIPLSCHWLEDKQAWRGESSGEYSVQSEYKLLLAKCTQEDESLEHAFRDCQAVKEIWSMLDISWPTEMSCASYKQWMDWLFMNSSSDLCRIIIYAIWVIWSDRNKHVHERKIKQNIDMVRFIVSYLKELEAIKSHLSARCVQQERWRDVSLPTNQVENEQEDIKLPL
ncbi:hypothetical protein Godav_018004, partial [Gossypium davidsonii]|nr:hypothetical protein [Gossypium davidsonii]